MLNNVSWGQYFTGVILILILYYPVIALLFYRNEIQTFLQPRKNSSSDTGPQKKQKADHIGKPREADEPFDGLEVVVSDLRGILEAGNGDSKEQLLGQLSTRLANYTGLRHPAFRAAITNYIITHAKELSGAAFSEQELNAAWDRLPR